MRIYASAHIVATESITVEDRSDLGSTIVYTGKGSFEAGDTLHIKGTTAERLDFLRRLADAADTAAAELRNERIVLGALAGISLAGFCALARLGDEALAEMGGEE